MTGFVEKLSNLEASLYEEESYFFLQYFQFAKKWFVYSSKEMELSFVKALADKFAFFSGKIPFSEEVSQHFGKDQISNRYWSAVPLGVFRYKMSSTGQYMILNSYKNTQGYIVEGAYWDNGFVYCVRDLEKIIELNLFIDKETKEIHAYPDKMN
jgi:hypothetical protein